MKSAAMQSLVEEMRQFDEDVIVEELKKQWGEGHVGLGSWLLKTSSMLAANMLDQLVCPCVVAL